MTGRAAAILAVAAMTVAALALAVRPLLPHPTTPLPAPGPAAMAAVPAPMLSTATTAVTRALACPSRSARRARLDCGPVQLTRRQLLCSTDTRCQVQLVGSLRTHTVEVPVALTVTLIDSRGHWHAVEVAS